ncbi:MAG: M28 family metallopeptidase [Promethearchaeota archaeon]
MYQEESISKENQFFKENRLYDHVKKFSFARLAGTLGEKKAVHLTVDSFKELGFKENQIIEENFKFSTFYSLILIKIIILMNIIIISVLLLIKYINPYLVFITSILLLIIFFSVIKVFKHPELKGFWERHFGKMISATNVYTKVPVKTSSLKNSGDIIISAHLDSKSQSFKTFWRVILYRIWLFGEIFIIICYIALIIDLHSEFESFIIVILTLEALIGLSTFLVISSNFILLFLNLTNKSSGALDNASGMAIVFELSHYFIKNPLDNFNLWFCQFSAEEIGTMGSRNFVDKHESYFIKGRTFQINFDMVSVLNNKENQLEYIKSYGIFPRKKISPILHKYIQESSKIEDIKINKFHVSVGAHTDSIPFHMRKFDSVDFTTRAAAIYTHSTEDTPDKIDPLILSQATIIARRMILLLDNEFNLKNI